MDGLRIQRTRVMSVKNESRIKVQRAVCLRRTPVNSAMPSNDSSRPSNVPNTLAAGIRKGSRKNLAYSWTMSWVPTGSMSFSRPDTRKTMPTNKAAKRRNR